MRAARLPEAGGPDLLRVEQVGTPAPGPGEVLIEVHAVGVNQLERQVMAGAPLGRPVLVPRTVGLDPTGVIAAVGLGVAEERVGERVAVKPNVPCGTCDFCTAGHEADCSSQYVSGIHSDGGAADYVVVPERVAFPIASSVGYAEAAAAVHSVPIALHMIRRAYGPAGFAPGTTVLVTGATGALGVACVQVCAALGARVVAGVLKGEPTGDLPSLGAAEVVEYPIDGSAELESAVRDIAPRGVPLALDATGSGALIGAALRLTSWAGHTVVAAALPESAFTVDTRNFYTRRVTLHGCAAADFTDVRDGLGLVADGRVSPVVATRMALEDIREAFEMTKRRDHLGKVVLSIR
ncbi:alcohol dehydrogenase catalytic domain-containing protein [Sinosporangium siamense]|uniref:Zn-dependent oxidoreductase n=1 Tax=Sinosporangium siamense TaxID=1367973 RepID=A0A919RER5_9ACTN|nr:alcohol dehydrogenase catalytic domain-containing protein [Sinosporangium siamense]GII90536.1 Zn-dependent oxidoreductase [Sinosporangium siamense]